MTGPPIVNWIADHQPTPGRLLRAKPELIEGCKQGHAAGLSWESLAEWVGLHGISIGSRLLAEIVRNA